MPSELPDLAPGETLLGHAAVSFRGATAASSRSTFALASARSRMRSYHEWEGAVQAAGFPTAGPDFVLGVTPNRLVVWKTSFGLGRPVAAAGDMRLDRVYAATAARRGLVTSLHIVLTDGTIVEMEAMRGRRLRALAAAITAALAASPPTA